VAEPGDIILTAAGSSSARLECTVRDREVASSNLAFPTISQQLNSNHPSAKSSDPTLTQPRLGPPARGARSDIHFPRRGNRADVGGGRSGMVIGRRVASVAAGLVCAAILSSTAADASSSWTIQPSPNPTQQDGDLGGVSCQATTACTAVGSYVNSAHVSVT